jgi:3D (Asp-Asp-Asp) domain-containing protein
MIQLTRIAALLGLASGTFLASCASTPKAAQTSLPKSIGPVNPDRACLARVSPTPGFYKKNGGLHAVVKTTAYCHTEKDSLKYGKANAMGCQLRYDTIRSAAADWSVFPAGTLFQIVGQPKVVYRIDDYGSALVGTRTIDLYQPTQKHMRAWGARTVEICILKWGSYSHSQQILADRSRHAHVRAMLTSMQRKRLVAKS